MAKILNLDKIANKVEKRSLVLGGTEYEVEEMTVENFITTSRTQLKLAEEKASLPDQIDAAVEMIVRSVKNIEESVLRKLSIQQLQAITAFVRGEDVDDVEDTSASAANKEGGEEGNASAPA